MCTYYIYLDMYEENRKKKEEKKRKLHMVFANLFFF